MSNLYKILIYESYKRNTINWSFELHAVLHGPDSDKFTYPRSTKDELNNKYDKKMSNSSGKIGQRGKRSYYHKAEICITVLNVYMDLLYIYLSFYDPYLSESNDKISTGRIIFNCFDNILTRKGKHFIKMEPRYYLLQIITIHVTFFFRIPESFHSRFSITISS